MPPTRATPLSNGPDETHVDRVHLQVTGDADRPSKIASREALAKRCAQPVTCICQHTAEPHAGRGPAIDLSERDLRLGTCHSLLGARHKSKLRCRSRSRWEGVCRSAAASANPL